MANVLTHVLLSWLTAGEAATGSSDGTIIEGSLNRPLNQLLENDLALQATFISVYGTALTTLGTVYEVNSSNELEVIDISEDPRDKIYGVGTGVAGTIQTGLILHRFTGLSDGRKWVDIDGTLRDDANVGSGNWRIYVGCSKFINLHIQLNNSTSIQQP